MREDAETRERGCGCSWQTIKKLFRRPRRPTIRYIYYIYGIHVQYINNMYVRLTGQRDKNQKSWKFPVPQTKLHYEDVDDGGGDFAQYLSATLLVIPGVSLSVDKCLCTYIILSISFISIAINNGSLFFYVVYFYFFM